MTKNSFSYCYFVPPGDKYFPNLYEMKMNMQSFHLQECFLFSFANYRENVEMEPYQERKSNCHGHGADQHAHQTSQEQRAPACLLHQEDLQKCMYDQSLAVLL